MNERNRTSPEGDDSPETSGQNRRKKVGKLIGGVAAGAVGVLALSVPTLVGVVGPHLANNAERSVERPRFDDCEWSGEVQDTESAFTNEGAFVPTTGKGRVVVLELDESQDNLPDPIGISFTRPGHSEMEIGRFIEDTVEGPLAVRAGEHDTYFTFVYEDPETNELAPLSTSFKEASEFEGEPKNSC